MFLKKIFFENWISRGVNRGITQFHTQFHMRKLRVKLRNTTIYPLKGQFKKKHQKRSPPSSEMLDLLKR